MARYARLTRRHERTGSSQRNLLSGFPVRVPLHRDGVTSVNWRTMSMRTRLAFICLCLLSISVAVHAGQGMVVPLAWQKKLAHSISLDAFTCSATLMQAAPPAPGGANSIRIERCAHQFQR